MNGVLPEGYRFRLQWIGWGATEVAGRYRRLEYVRVVQRLMDESWPEVEDVWADVGFWDEVYPSLMKVGAVEDFA